MIKICRSIRARAGGPRAARGARPGGGQAGRMNALEQVTLAGQALWLTLRRMGTGRLWAPWLLLGAVQALVLLGLTGIFGYNVFFFLGLQTVTASRASLIVANNPVFIALFATLLLGERMTAGRGAGIFLSLLGAVVVITRGNPVEILQGGIGVGELYILGCVASWVAYSLLGKTVMARLSPLAAVTFSFPVFFMLIALSNMIGLGASVMISQAIGAKDRKRASTISKNAVVMSVMLSLVSKPLPPMSIIRNPYTSRMLRGIAHAHLNNIGGHGLHRLSYI